MKWFIHRFLRGDLVVLRRKILRFGASSDEGRRNRTGIKGQRDTANLLHGEQIRYWGNYVIDRPPWRRGGDS
jgi:hypothetical protein